MADRIDPTERVWVCGERRLRAIIVRQNRNHSALCRLEVPGRGWVTRTLLLTSLVMP
jgi:hypothetical protein